MQSLTPFLRFPQAKFETKALKAKRPGFSEDRYNETSYYVENGEACEASVWSLRPVSGL